METKLLNLFMEWNMHLIIYDFYLGFSSNRLGCLICFLSRKTLLMIKFLYADTFDYLLCTHLGVLELFVAQKLRKKRDCYFF